MVSATTATAKKSSAAAAKKPRSHPPYAEMITEAITSLKERTGSSQVAIAKFIEEKQKDLPSNFRKLLLVQLKKLVASGKLTKIKGSFKVSPVVKPVAVVKKPTATGAANPKAKVDAPKKKKVAVKKPKATATTPAKKVKKPVTAPAKVKKTPVKKPAVAKVKKTPVKKVVKKPKSIKTTPAGKKAKK
ncbi:unnamed protein product [Withania somnifera]